MSVILSERTFSFNGDSSSNDMIPSLKPFLPCIDELSVDRAIKKFSRIKMDQKRPSTQHLLSLHFEGFDKFY